MLDTNIEVTPATDGATMGGESSPPPSPSPEDMAAHDYQMLLPKFKEACDPLSRRQMQRVVDALMEYPLENQNPRFSYTEERNAFNTGMQLLDCKLVLTNYVLALTKNKEKMEEFKAEYDRLEAAKGKTE